MGNFPYLGTMVRKREGKEKSGKNRHSPYLPDQAKWLKIRNRQYSQWAGREELFDRERGGDPDFGVWNGCALACESADAENGGLVL